MSRYNIATTKTTGAAAGIIAQLRTGSSRDLRLFEVGIFATTAVAGQVALNRPTAVGSGFTSTSTGQPEDNVSGAGVAVVDTVATTPPTLAATHMRIIQLPATIGAGIIWTFANGLVVPVSAAITLQQLSAAAVTYAFYFVYDE